MKKLIVFIFVSLLFCQTSYALTQDSAIKQHLSGRELDNIEGIWLYSSGSISAIFKSGSNFSEVIIRSSSGLLRPGDYVGNYQKGSGTLYYGSRSFFQPGYGFWGDKYKELKCETTLALQSINSIKTSCETNAGSISDTISRIWPENFNTHNAKYQKGSSSNTAESKKIGGAAGTAFFVTSEGHLITNHHVVKRCGDESKIVFKNKDIPVKLLAKDEMLDLALLKADLRLTEYIILSDDKPKKLQRIIAAGYPLGKSLSDDLKFTSGIISSLKGYNDDSTLIQIDAALNKGNSGGPIVDEESGELVGVAVAGLDKAETEAVNFGIKTS